MSMNSRKASTRGLLVYQEENMVTTQSWEGKQGEDTSFHSIKMSTCHITQVPVVEERMDTSRRTEESITLMTNLPTTEEIEPAGIDDEKGAMERYIWAPSFLKMSILVKKGPISGNLIMTSFPPNSK